MLRRMHVNFPIFALAAAKHLLGRASHGGRPVEYADDRRSLRATIIHRTSKDMISRHATLAIGRSGQRHLRRLAGYEVFDLDRIADGVNVGVAGLKPIIDANPATRSNIEAGFDGELVL